MLRPICWAMVAGMRDQLCPRRVLRQSIRRRPRAGRHILRATGRSSLRGGLPLARRILPRRKKSGANPDNDKRHRQGGDEGDGNRRGECAKQIYLMANVVYRHAACSTARDSKRRRRHDAVTASLLGHCVQKVQSDGDQRWLTEYYGRSANGYNIGLFNLKAVGARRRRAAPPRGGRQMARIACCDVFIIALAR